MRKFPNPRPRELSLFSIENTEREISDHIYRHQLTCAAEFLRKNHHADVSRMQCLLRLMMPKDYYPMIEELKEDHTSPASYSITGGQNVIAPNATTATQNFYGKQE